MTTIKLKNGSGAPLAGDLVQGEPALDLTNKRLYTENSSGAVIEVGTNPSTINIDAGTIDGTVIGGSTAAAGSFTTFTSTGIDDNAASTAITIDGSQNVGIGTSSPTSYSGQTNLNINSAGVSRIDFDISDALQGYALAESGYIALFANTGKYLMLGANNTEAMRIDASGNVGIGTGSPSGPLNVHSASGDTNLYVTTGNTAASTNIFFGDSGNSTIGRIVYDHNGNYMKFRTNGSDAMRIDSNGSVGIGTSSPSTYDSRTNNLVVGDSGDAGVTIFSGSTSNARLQFAPSGATGLDNGLIDYDNNNDSMSFATGGSERTRIDSSGNFRVGISTDPAVAGSEGIELNGSNGFITTARNTAAPAGHHQFVNSNGVAGTITTSGSSTTYGTSSDYRLKENVVPLTGATERVKQLNPSRFNFIADADTTVDGFLAHEVADVVPEAITGTKDGMRDEEYEVTPAVYEDVVIPAVLDEEGNEVEAERTEQQLVTEAVMGTRSVPDYQGIDQSKLVPLLVATIQELEARITALESN